jgi:trehalose/maltose transport system substrate-binding protein
MNDVRTGPTWVKKRRLHGVNERFWAILKAVMAGRSRVKAPFFNGRWAKTSLCILGLTLLGMGTPGAATLTISCGVAESTSYYDCKEAAQRWAQDRGHSVWVLSSSPDDDVALDNYLRILRSREHALDLLPMEMAWAPALSEYLADVRPSLGGSERSYVPSALQAFMFDNRLLGLPWYLDVGVLYYREDLLKQTHVRVPQTWEGLFIRALTVQRAQRAAGVNDFWGFTFHASDSQALSSLAVEWFDAAGDLPLIDRFGRVVVATQHHAPTLTLWSSVIGQVVPDNTLALGEEDSRRLFQSGRAAFLRGGPHTWPLINGEGSAVAGVVGVTRLPTGRPSGVHSTSLGGWALAVPKHSKHPALALELARHLAGDEQQRRRASLYAYAPSLSALYKDAALLNQVPPLAVVRDSLPYLVYRPIHESGRQYHEVSNVISSRLRAALTTRQVVPQLKALRQDLLEMRSPHGFEGAETVARPRRFQRHVCDGPPSIFYITCR